MRLKFRFSLRSLLLAMLTLGAAAALWRNFEPWRIERELVFDLNSNPKENLLMGSSPDGKWVHAETSLEETPGLLRYASIIWNMETGRTFHVTHEIETNVSNWLCESEFSADSTLLLSEAANKNQYSAKLWDVKNNIEIVIPELASLVRQNITTRSSFDMNRVQFCPDSRHILVMPEDGSARLINVVTKSVLNSIPDVRDEEFSLSGDLVVLRCGDETIRVHETRTGRELTRLIRPVDWEFVRIRYVSNQLLMVEGIPTESLFDWDERSVLCYDLKSPSEPTIFSGSVDWRANVSKDQTLAVFSDNFEFRVVDLRTQKVISRAPCSTRVMLEWLAGNARIFNMDGGEMHVTSTGRLLYEIENVSLALPSPDLRIALVYSHGSRNCRLHDLANGELLQVIPNERIGAWYLVSIFSSDSSRFITQNADTRAIHLWTRHRPEYWWGLAWLSEFWLTVVLAAAFLWSLRRDWLDSSNRKSAAISTPLPLA